MKATIAPVTLASTTAAEMVAGNAVGLWASDRYLLVPMRTLVWLAADRSCRVGGPDSFFAVPAAGCNS